jgi:hypothetical protein
VRKALVKADEITLELLAQTTIGMLELDLPRYAGIHEYEMIPKAYQFLRACKRELEDAPTRIARFNALNSEGAEGPATWTDIRKATRPDNERLIKFFEQNREWAMRLRPRSKPNNGAPEWPLNCKEMVLPKTSLPYLKIAFEGWLEQEISKNLVRKRTARARKKKVKKSS